MVISESIDIFIRSTTLLAALFAGALFARADDLATTSDPEELGFSSARLARLTAWYQAQADAMSPSYPAIPGAVVAIAKDGKLAYLKAIGFQDRARTVSMKPDSIFWIASMSKPITSVAAMILVDEGKLELDAPVARCLPAFAGQQVARELPGAKPGGITYALEPAKRPMTIRDLLRHTSGVVYPDRDFFEPTSFATAIHELYGARARFGPDDDLAEFADSLARLPLAHQPGEVWEYSWSADLLARVIEVASGESFDTFLKRSIFDPLHMVDTSFVVPVGKLSRLVDWPGPREPRFDVSRPRRLFSGGGGLVSTAADYLRFGQMLLDGGELDGIRVLSAKAVYDMTRDQLPPDIRFANHLIGPVDGSSWGLGFEVRVNTERSNVPGTVGSFRWSGVSGTYFWVDPGLKLVVVQMVQALPGQASLTFGAIRRLTYGALRVPEPSATRLEASAEALAPYTGTYDFGPSTSSRDRIGAFSAGIGAELELSTSGPKIKLLLENSPSDRAGLRSGDVITAIEGASVKGLSFDQALAKLRGAVDTIVRLSIQRDGASAPIEIAITRSPVGLPGVRVKVREVSGGLSAESVGAWPILDFENGKAIELVPMSDHGFFIDSEDHTRIAFTRDATGKVNGAILNPGPFQQRGWKVEEAIAK